MKVELLSSIPLFASLPRQEIEHLAANLQTRHFPAGAIILHEGRSSQSCFIVEEGRVEIIKSLGTSDERILAVRETGTLLGEMSLFIKSNEHTASVRALTPLTLLEITQKEFDALLHRQPGIVYEIARLMSQRLNESEDLTILDLREKNRQLTQAYEELKAAHEQIVEKELLEKELQIARRIQQSILPQVIPQYETLQCCALMVPARAVGGDFYDFIPFEDGLVGVVVGDVSDKGVPAALFMGLTYSLVRAEASQGISPGETLRRVNRHLLDINVTNMFVTLVYGILNTRTGIFNYARAGQPPPYLIAADGKCLHVQYELGQALGLFDDPVLDERSIELPPGGCLLLFSDGLTEAMDQAGDYFDLESLCTILQGYKPNSPSDICAGIWQTVQTFVEGVHQSDDFTIAVLQRKL